MIKILAVASGTKQLRAVLFGAVILLQASGAAAGIHTWDVIEVFSNADGTIQYVELLDPTGPSELGIGSSSISSSLHTFGWTVSPPLVGPTTGKSFLIGTAAFAALPGAPTLDVTIPAANVPFFNTAGDTITIAADSFIFGAVPTNGTDSLDDLAGVGPNTPKNYAGTQGSVNASPSPSVPSVSMPLMLLLVSLLVIGGVVGQRRIRSATR